MDTSYIISKMNNNGRACFITSYSALTSGDFASGENSVRKYLVDNDMIECIVSLPLLFSPVSKVTPYLWILSKSKEEISVKHLRFIIHFP